MSIWQPMQGGTGYFKASFQGNTGSGKTYTAVSLACAIHAHFGCSGPIAVVDTEGGARFHGPRLTEKTGHVPLIAETRDLSKVHDALMALPEQGVEVVLIDSVTHLWQGLMDGYVEAKAKKYRRDPSQVRLELFDIGNVKRMWKWFPEWLVSSQCHVIICGRLGDDWAFVEDDEGKKQLESIGHKLKAEKELGYEPHFSMEMQLVQRQHPEFQRAEKAGDLVTPYERAIRGTVIKDRTGVLHGTAVWNPDEDFFAPVLRRYDAGSKPVPVDQMDVELGGWDYEDYKRRKEIALESIEGYMSRAAPSTSKAEKQAKVDLIEAIAGTPSWEAVKRMKLAELQVVVPVIGKHAAILRHNLTPENVSVACKAIRAEMEAMQDEQSEPSGSDGAGTVGDAVSTDGGARHPEGDAEAPGQAHQDGAAEGSIGMEDIDAALGGASSGGDGGEAAPDPGPEAASGSDRLSYSSDGIETPF